MKSRHGVIIDGVYYANGKKPGLHKRASTDKQYDFDMQRTYHQRDLLQPRENGKPNEEFIAQYPDEATKYGFIKKE